MVAKPGAVPPAWPRPRAGIDPANGRGAA